MDWGNSMSLSFFEESLGYKHVGSCGNGLDIKPALAKNTVSMTPFLDKLATKELF